MLVEVDFPLYAVSDEGTGNVLVAAEEVEGFFVDPEEEPTEVAFLRAHELNKGRRRTEDAVLEIMNRRQEKIGEYFIGRVVLGDTGQESPDGKISRVPYQYFGNRCEYPGAEKIWQRWATGATLHKGEWLQWPVSYQSAWLHVVQNSWFASNHGSAQVGVDCVAHLDGTNISTRSGFFCALGEAVNGPGGYFGSNLDALADCIASRFTKGSTVKIVWKDFDTSRELLSDAFLDSVMGVIRESRVDITVC
ncbi:barstar family protein [Streptomyces sp. NPDC048248]|uniref:barstar family protein n=1 Tax=Streptomyces sp. NPDC048248 TaxID=3365523 RepID=UPI00371460CC